MGVHAAACLPAFIGRYFIFVQLCVHGVWCARVQRAGRAPAHFSAEPRGPSTRRHHPMPAPPAPGARRMLPLHCTVAWQLLRQSVSQPSSGVKHLQDRAFNRRVGPGNVVWLGVEALLISGYHCRATF